MVKITPKEKKRIYLNLLERWRNNMIDSWSIISEQDFSTLWIQNSKNQWNLTSEPLESIQEPHNKSVIATRDRSILLIRRRLQNPMRNLSSHTKKYKNTQVIVNLTKTLHNSVLGALYKLQAVSNKKATKKNPKNRKY